MFDSEMGRFVSRDTWEGRLWLPSTLHRYSYANANPVNFIDPSGEESLVGQMTAVGIVGVLSSIAVVKLTAIMAATVATACAANWTLQKSMQYIGWPDAGGTGPCDARRVNKMRVQLQQDFVHIHGIAVYPIQAKTVSLTTLQMALWSLYSAAEFSSWVMMNKFPFHAGQQKFDAAIKRLNVKLQRYPPKGGTLTVRLSLESETFRVKGKEFRVDVDNFRVTYGPNLFLW